MGGFNNPVAGGGGALVRDSIHSPDFATGVQGWTINQDGSAEFNNVVIRGGTTTQGVILIYNGTPAAGNLVASIAPAAGTDSFGNAYKKGITVYFGAATYIQLTTDTGTGDTLINFNPDSTVFTEALLTSFASGATSGGLQLVSTKGPDAGDYVSRLELYGSDLTNTAGSIARLEADVLKLLTTAGTPTDPDIEVNGGRGYGINRIIYAASGQNVNNSIVLTDDAELVTTLDANSLYKVKIRATYNTAVNCDLQTDWTVPAGATGSRHTLGATQTAAAFTSRLNTAAQVGTRGFASVVIYQIDAGAAAQTIFEEGLVKTGASGGNLRLRWSQAVAVVGNLSRESFSFMEVMKVSQ